MTTSEEIAHNSRALIVVAEELDRSAPPTNLERLTRGHERLADTFRTVVEKLESDGAPDDVVAFVRAEAWIAPGVLYEAWRHGEAEHARLERAIGVLATKTDPAWWRTVRERCARAIIEAAQEEAGPEQRS